MMCYKHPIKDENEYRRAISHIQSGISLWGQRNMRKYPWRETQDVYKIMVAEIMLHRTKSDQVKELYRAFVEKYPDFKSIVLAGRETIESELRPLGLRWRAKLFYEMAEEVVEKYGGILPADRERLMQLPGVGHYISSAVLCFGYNLPAAILDVNTVRIIGRFFGIKVNDSSRRSRKFEKIMHDLVLHGEPKQFSLSMIDFAAAICIPGDKPRCQICPIKDGCCFYEGMVV